MIVHCEKNTIHDMTRNHRTTKGGSRSRSRGRVVVESSKKKFGCRTISNPVELMKMGYDPSRKMIPMNDYEMNEVLKQVA
jgi:hypothetical protein